MGIPTQNMTLNDPGLASSEPASMVPLFIGPSSGGAGGPVTSVPGAVGTIDITHVTGSSVVSVHATPVPDGTYAIEVLFAIGATIGVAGAYYQVSLDGGINWGTATALGTAAYITVHGVRFDFATGDLHDGDYFLLATTGPVSTSLGDLYAIQSHSQPGTVVTQYGEGPLAEDATFVLSNGGGPVLTMRTEASIAAVLSAVTKTAIGTSTGTITVAGTPYDDYVCQVEITGTGTVGVGTFRYTLDKSDMRASDTWTWSPEIRIPAGATYAIARTGITLTFVPGAGAVFFEDGDLHDFTATGAKMNTTDLANAFTAILASHLPWRFLVVCSQPSSAAVGASFFAALAVHMTSLETIFRFRRAMMATGSDTAANVSTQYNAQTSTRILAAFGDADIASSKAFVARGIPRRSVRPLFARNATGPKSLGWGIPSTDLKRGKGGALPGIPSKADGSPAITHNEYTTEVLDSQKIATVRTYPNRAGGAYITQGRLKSPAGSDYTRWDLGIIMDIACEFVVEQQAVWIGDDIRTNDDKSIDDRDAGRIETQINAILKSELLDKPGASGFQGYAQDAKIVVNRTADVATTGYVTTTVGIKPLFKIEGFNTTLGYVYQTIQIPVTVA
jgi:hypothetical protein